MRPPDRGLVMSLLRSCLLLQAALLALRGEHLAEGQLMTRTELQKQAKEKALKNVT